MGSVTRRFIILPRRVAPRRARPAAVLCVVLILFVASHSAYQLIINVIIEYNLLRNVETFLVVYL